MIEQRKIAVIGLGYVGLTTAVAFGKTQQVIGYDINERRIHELKNYYDFNREISKSDLHAVNIHFTTTFDDLADCDFFIITLPTPLNSHLDPDLSILLQVSDKLGKYIKKGDIVVYESTVYPGATDSECIPILEASSKLKCGKDFGVSFSPERVNPGDTVHTFTNVVKVISASDPKTLKTVSDVYSSVIKAGVYLVSNIKVAEATKIIENVQRDINIAYLNEVAQILHGMDLELTEVLKAMHTKWNALNFKPGLVGGHCIGVNAHYLTYQAHHKHMSADLIMTARKINESMPQFLAAQTIHELRKLNIAPNNARIGIMGLTFKENCPDLKDTMIVNLIYELNKYKVITQVFDPIANPELSLEQCNIEITPWENMQNFNAIIVAVAHNYFIGQEQEIINRIKGAGLVIDLKGILNHAEFAKSKVKLWQL